MKTLRSARALLAGTFLVMTATGLLNTLLAVRLELAGGTAAGVITALVVDAAADLPLYWSFPTVIGAALVASVAATLITAPVELDTLVRFWHLNRMGRIEGAPMSGILMLFGAEDPATPPEKRQAMEALYPKAESIVFEGGQHAAERDPHELPPQRPGHRGLRRGVELRLLRPESLRAEEQIHRLGSGLFSGYRIIALSTVADNDVDHLLFDAEYRVEVGHWILEDHGDSGSPDIANLFFGFVQQVFSLKQDPSGDNFGRRHRQ